MKYSLQSSWQMIFAVILDIYLAGYFIIDDIKFVSNMRNSDVLLYIKIVRFRVSCKTHNSVFD